MHEHASPEQQEWLIYLDGAVRELKIQAEKNPDALKLQTNLHCCRESANFDHPFEHPRGYPEPAGKEKGGPPRDIFNDGVMVAESQRAKGEIEDAKARLAQLERNRAKVAKNDERLAQAEAKAVKENVVARNDAVDHGKFVEVQSREVRGDGSEFVPRRSSIV